MMLIVISLLMANKSLNFRRKTKVYQKILSLGNISADFNQADKKSTGLYGYVYDFSVDYQTIVVDDILDFHTYLMKKIGIV